MKNEELINKLDKNMKVFVISPSMNGNGGYCGSSVIAETTLEELLSLTPYDYDSEFAHGCYHEYSTAFRIHTDKPTVLGGHLFFEDTDNNVWKPHIENIKKYLNKIENNNLLIENKKDNKIEYFNYAVILYDNTARIEKMTPEEANCKYGNNAFKIVKGI